MKKITFKVEQYEKFDSFEASIVSRPLSSVEIQRERCLKILAQMPKLPEFVGVLARAEKDLQDPEAKGSGGRLTITPFVAEELARLEDRDVPRYLFHRFRYDVFPVRRELDDFPPYVQIEPTSTCNFRCVFCYQTDPSFSARGSEHMGMMSIDTFKRIVDQIEGKVEFVSFASRGEPLMCRDLPLMLDYARGKFLNLKINTNASILTESRSHALLSGAVGTVVFSADAAEEPLYSRLRVNGKLSQVLRNIERFEEIRQKHYPDSRVITRVSGVFVDQDQDINKMVAVWGGMVDEVSFVKYNPWENVYESPFSETSTPCSDLWRRMFIWFDGRVNPCDTDYKSVLAVGSVDADTVSVLWRGSAYEKMRAIHEGSRRGSLHPCNRCVVV